MSHLGYMHPVGSIPLDMTHLVSALQPLPFLVGNPQLPAHAVSDHGDQKIESPHPQESEKCPLSFKEVGIVLLVLVIQNQCLWEDLLELTG